ncbi:Nicotinate-nucleotide adenylyltransferase [hydrothermal vent metagenome]|uniref:Nicotinate-nucleotide adenylyltransferase n=1 Tax=hydrothermal vent metagenome TaxID=652676 RepID=A0A3B0WEY2_9ZZZZ
MIGIFGGTFDPVHYGHIKPALSIKQALNLNQLRFIPNRIPPHREIPWLSTEQRLSLLKRALLNYDDVVIDERELERDGPSYMVDTLVSLRDDFANEGLILIVGMDAFLGITAWHEWKRLFDLCHLVVTTRPGFDESEIMERIDADNYQYLAAKMVTQAAALTPNETGKILLQSVPQLDISSTKIRANWLTDDIVRQWMPEATYQQLREIKYDH